ncbi:arginine--tRNA ligase [Thiomicrospira sp. WB1]|uniref:arginine--tRNA ligase n=1 Tax=Thiomicrospira sp. WB1 TaxID=1685380 RepID=UPI0007499ED9|nr:arginine--tRNA ligase [Thiomicrospira sp. WB1]KUJ71195.1 arginine--tRNA ligase [Thiomicrospira sp. WB1]
MKSIIEQCLHQAVEQLKQDELLADSASPRIHIENTKDKAHGDLASNLAMMLTKAVGQPPRDVAQMIIDRLPVRAEIAKVEIAGPGFLNFFMADEAKFDIVTEVLTQKEAFGRCQVGQGRRVLVEFVSANPTGPLHVGHGRGAAYGASVASLLATAGFKVQKEYYVNDAGRQMDILAASTWVRYLQRCGESIAFPANGYQGDYIYDIADALVESHGEAFRHSAETVLASLPADEPDGGDKETYIDALIERAKTLLENGYEAVLKAALDAILQDIQEDLAEFGVTFDEWFSERSLMDSGLVDAAIEKLQQAGKIYEQNGALWFRSSDYGDEKDRVVVRDNGLKTYFASDIAYHFNKLEREFDVLIDVWGADHHGYVPRVKAAMAALETDPDALQVLLVQFASLWRGGEKLAMSTRSGQFVTLRQLRHDVGTDAARFFYVQRKSEQHMDFDLDLAKSQSNENPIYYIQYAHARICQVLNQAADKGWALDIEAGLANMDQLEADAEKDLAILLAKYPETIARAASAYEPHQIAYYLKDLAQGLHTYYNACQFVVDDASLRNARLTLVSAVRQVLQNGLAILGVAAPERM